MDESEFEVRIETLGCRLNQIESEAIGKCFVDNNYSVCLKPVTAGSAQSEKTLLCIVNSCTVTQKAEQKCRRIIRLLLKKFPNSVILITGCYAQLSPQEILAIDKRICVIGGQIKSRISAIPVFMNKLRSEGEWQPEKIAAAIQENIVQRKIEKIGFPEKSFKLAATSFIAHSRASLKIQDGCNNNCSFCAIHIARGHSVSLDAEEVLERIKSLEAKGFSEVVLTAVNIGQYKGKYKDGFMNFSSLLRYVLDNTAAINIRISSLYPEVVDDDFCKVVSDSRVCPHFHLSVQSGSDRILKLMNRPYFSSDVIEACKKLKSCKKNPFLACDIITGFPGETDDDFNKTLELCSECGFAWVHAFPYSERPGTDAVGLPDKVPQRISGERCERITKQAIESKIQYIQNFVGQELNAVLETARSPSVMNPSVAKKIVYHAVTDNFIHCEIATEKFYKENTKVCLNIKSVLKERILKGGEIEASAEIKD